MIKSPKGAGISCCCCCCYYCCCCSSFVCLLLHFEPISEPLLPCHLSHYSHVEKGFKSPKMSRSCLLLLLILLLFFVCSLACFSTPCRFRRRCFHATCPIIPSLCHIQGLFCIAGLPPEVRGERRRIVGRLPSEEDAAPLPSLFAGVQILPCV